MSAFWDKKHTDHDAIILDLLTRVCTLEQQVKELKAELEKSTISKHTYEDLVVNFTANPRDVHTIPVSWTPKWFYVFVDKNALYVQSGRYHAPDNSNISGSRLLDPKEFDVVLAFYQRRKAGENVASELNVITQNGSYWFGIFAELDF